MQIHAYRRTELTPVSLFGLNIMFAPNDRGHVVADVDDERATERLLSISEAYCPYQPSAVATAVAEVAPRPTASAPVPPPPVPPSSTPTESENDTQEEALLGVESLPEVITIAEGKTVPRDQVLQSAFARSGFDIEEWNLNDADDREGLLEAEVRHLVAAEQAAVDQAAALAEQSQQAEQATAASAPAAAPAPASNPLVISNGEQTIDLGTYSAAKVREFAAANDIALPTGNSTKVAELRLLVAKALGAKV